MFIKVIQVGYATVANLFEAQHKMKTLIVWKN